MFHKSAGGVASAEKASSRSVAELGDALRRKLAEHSTDEYRIARHLCSLRNDPHVRFGDVLGLLAQQAELAAKRAAALSSLLDWVEAYQLSAARSAARLTTKVHEHERAIDDMCILIRDFDDPYGFGASLDQRIATESDEPPDEA